MRDQIRGRAEITGSTTMTGEINDAIQKSLNAITALAKYDECFVLGAALTIDANGVAALPSTLQHFDDKEVYFLRDGSVEIGSRYRLHPFTRSRVTTFGPASQFRLFGAATGGVLQQKLLITPFIDISTADDRVQINYWQQLDFSSEILEFPFPKLEEVVILRAASHVCRSTNTRLANKLMAEYQNAYVAVRAASPVRNI